jgi:hypothetical protein
MVTKEYCIPGMLIRFVMEPGIQGFQLRHGPRCHAPSVPINTDNIEIKDHVKLVPRLINKLECLIGDERKA